LILNIHPSQLYGRSITQLLTDLRLNYVVISSGLIFLGFFWNNLEGFNWQYVTLFMSVFSANLFGFVANDFYDSTCDFKESNKNTRNIFCTSNMKWLGKSVLYASLGLSLLFSAIISPHICLIIAILDVLAFSYSAPPIRLRNRPYWDWIFVFLWKGLIIFAGHFYFSGITLPKNPFVWGTLAIVLQSSLIHQIDNQIRDFEVDKITHTNNSVQHLGFHNASSINRILLILFYTFSFVFCYFLDLYITMILIFLNVSLYFLVNPNKHCYIIEFTNIWIVVLFLEHFMAHVSVQQQFLFSFWIALMGVITIRHVKHINLFN